MSLIIPPPRRLTRHGGGVPFGTVALVGVTGADRAAETVVRSALAAAGIHRVGVPDPDLTIRFARGPGRPEAYRVVTGPGDVLLEGSDEAGTFYAAQVFARLLDDGLPSVTVEDHPAMAWRGSIEGFYGTPWTHRERLAHLDFLGAHRMNTYVYAPKDDPYHRDRWREAYPPDELARLAELVDRAGANHVRFVFTVSPGLSIRYSEPADLDALLAKFAAVRALGCADFCVALDDIDPTVWHDPRDEAAHGHLGAAHAWLVNRVREWAGVPVQFVPTEYHGLAATRYKKEVRDLLAPDTAVWWTGHDVIPATITVEEARQARELFGHPILVWDNYPVNDYIAGRVPLGPYDGRENGLSAHVDGVLSNPANQVAMSTVALSAFAEYGWDDTGFDAAAVHRRALAALGDDEDLAAFADLNTRDDRLHHDQAPIHAAALAVIRDDLARGDRAAAITRLTELADRLIALPGRIADARFAVEAEAWLAATRLWGEALAALVPVLEHGTGHDHVRRLAASAAAVRDDRHPHRTTGVLVGDGVLDVFLMAVLDAY
ncbi:beta-N-acetylhexosaminidase family protein [Actinophytocola algeriensis]|uniref:Hyaluronoglucosaminidase n=1 Tax=Actinophytocola algeriensis TaxID=1768010 RepID=A0A7W7VGW6_9PSEU|nr:beta-N-acetylglucosaminidase domain-containing protein [Actinophytocola algeriensis]MBB4909778.1 hyaluronoglucosaminidase [Actinophytocola algeriensis]MBE1475768.1 hyaluronoglucosaminidase [Actinophytocola algeriensis]